MGNAAAGREPSILSAERLEGVAATIARAAGASQAEAALIARHLVEADLRGHPSHGINVLPGYVAAIQQGELVLGQALEIAVDAGALLLCNARRGAGQVTGHEAMALAIDRARRHGACVIGLRDSYHLGRIGHFAEQCAAAELVSVHFVNVPGAAVVAPFGGTQGRLGTNPFAAGFPRPGAEPIIVDFATSRLAYGKVRVAFNKGEALPPGALLDGGGHPTTNPADLFATPPGVLLPFGEHKGYALALACELLAGALTGGATQAGAEVGIINSMLSIILSPETLGTAPAFAKSLEALAAWVCSEPGVHLPGGPESETRARRLAEGVPVDAVTLAALKATATDLGIEAHVIETALGKPAEPSIAGDNRC
jgi:uncharacterized oxidoreductase